MSHSFLTLSVVTGHLACFRVLAVVNDAAEKMRVRHIIELVFSSSLDKHPEVELPGHVMVLLFNYLRKLHTVFYPGCFGNIPPTL